MTETLSEPTSSVWRRFGIIQGVATVVLVGAVIAGWHPTAKAAGSAGVLAMLTAAAVTWVVFFVSMALALLWRPSPLDPANAGLTVLMASGIRFILILLIAFPIGLLGAVSTKPFLIWIGISYLAALAADTATLTYILSHSKD